VNAADASGESFRYRAVDREGRMVSDVVRAQDSGAALRQLAADGLTVTELKAAPVALDGADRDLRLSERVLIMRQLAIMRRAGVPLLEALETVAAGLRSARGRRQFGAVGQALRQGEPFADCLAAHAPGFPGYVYAMVRVGEASGRGADVLADAAGQMAYEDRLRRDVVNALTYPAFLAFAGAAAVTFIFVEIVPRFAVMIGPDRPQTPWISKAVLALGAFVNAHVALLGAGLALLAITAVLTASRPEGRAMLYRAARGAPLIGGVLRAREVSLWARLLGLALANGVALLPAAALARAGAPAGPFAQGLEKVEDDLRAGQSLDAALRRHTRLTAMDLSLVRAGQRSGSLPAMFGYMADAHDERLRDDVKRITALIEPLAVAMIAGVVGMVALALVMALASIYETVY
jgi:general secretion pathway protein F